MRGVGGKRWSGAAVVQVIWKKFLFQLTYRIAEHLKYSLVKISVCKLINSMSIMVYNCKLRHPWTTFCLLYTLYSCSCYGDGILFTLNIVPLARCVFLMLFVKKKNVNRLFRFMILGTQNANEIQVHEHVGNSFLISYKVHIIKL